MEVWKIVARFKFDVSFYVGFKIFLRVSVDISENAEKADFKNPYAKALPENFLREALKHLFKIS